VREVGRVESIELVESGEAGNVARNVGARQVDRIDANAQFVGDDGMARFTISGLG
jgi:hypothetical protein